MALRGGPTRSTPPRGLPLFLLRSEGRLPLATSGLLPHQMGKTLSVLRTAGSQRASASEGNGAECAAHKAPGACPVPDGLAQKWREESSERPPARTVGAKR